MRSKESRASIQLGFDETWERKTKTNILDWLWPNAGRILHFQILKTKRLLKWCLEQTKGCRHFVLGGQRKFKGKLDGATRNESLPGLMVSTQRDWCAAKQCWEMFERKEKQSIKDRNRNGDGDILKRMRIVSVLCLQATSVLGYEESNVVSCSLFWYCWPVNATSIFCFYSGFAFNNKQFLWLKRSFHPLYSVNLDRVFLWVNSISWNVLLKIIVNTK